jgi:hypothetical protein
MARVKIALPRVVGPRWTARIALAMVAALACWVAAFATGLFPWLGYASRSGRSISIGPFPVGEANPGGLRFGLSNFLFVAGQTIVLSYDAKIADGCLSMHVWRVFSPSKPADFNQCVTASGKGEWTVPVSATGIYHIFVTPRPIKGRWDMSFSVWWGAKR